MRTTKTDVAETIDPPYFRNEHRGVGFLSLSMYLCRPEIWTTWITWPLIELPLRD